MTLRKNLLPASEEGKQKYSTPNQVIIPTLYLYSLPKQNIPRYRTNLVTSLVLNKQAKHHGYDIWKVLILLGATILLRLFSAQM